MPGGPDGLLPVEGEARVAVSYETTVLRPDDLLVLHFQCVNLRLDVPRRRLIRVDAAAASYLIVLFAPQHLQEQAFLSDGGVQAHVAAVAAGPSRLVFRLPDAMDGIDYTLASLLDWTGLRPSPGRH